MARSTPWAILACEFNDTTAHVGSLDYLRSLYTDAGVGTGNIVDYFDTVSHGAIDLRGSEVFGWLDLQRPRTDYIGNVPDDKTPSGKLNRNGLIRHARSIARENDIDLSRFFSVVVTTTPAVDLFGNIVPFGALAATNTTPQLLMQEMGHGYGLQHSRNAQGSLVSSDYGDPYDIMSGPNCQGFFGPYGLAGPGLSAANMRGRGWLDESRVHHVDKETDRFPMTVTVRPLFATELPGNLAVAVDDTFIEFRDPVGWDAGLSQPVVLVHYLDGDISYLHKGYTGIGMKAGDSWHWGSLSATELPSLSVHVDAIDAADRTATVTIGYRPGTGPHDNLKIPPVGKLPWEVTVEEGAFGELREPRWRHGQSAADFHVPAKITGTEI